MVTTQQVLVRCVSQLISLGFCCSRRLAHFLGREETVLRSISIVMAAAVFMASAAPVSAFNMRQALQAVENLTQWSVMAEHCGEKSSASHIRQSTMHAIQGAAISSGERQKLANEVTYWVNTINRNFRTGGLHVDTACPIWEASGEREVKKELVRLHKQLG